jgi:hypothetical protein
MKILVLVMTLFAAAFAFGCSTSTEKPQTAPDSQAANSSVNSVETAEKPEMLGETPVLQKGEPVFDNVSPAQVQQAKTKGDYLSRPAPEDSLFKAEMTHQGMPIETRTFKSHPQILKVERLWITTKEKRLKVYLRNGKTVEADGSSFDHLNIAASSQILEAAGIKPAVPVGNPGKSDDNASKESN